MTTAQEIQCQPSTSENVPTKAIPTVDSVEGAPADTAPEDSMDIDNIDPEIDNLQDEEDQLNVTIKVTPDGGVTKKIISLGEGYEKPQPDDEVSVTYIGRLVPDGDVFDQNTDKQRPFTFGLDKGMVIKGWDKGIATMKKGERAILTIKPEYAYGATGAPPKIPANATLEFEVELLDWKSVNSLTPDGRVILRMIKKDESAWSTPKEGWEVVMDYKLTATVAGEEKLVEEKKDVRFTLGEEQPFGSPSTHITAAVKKFKKGERGILTIASEYAYGHEGDSVRGIPPDATLKYDISLIRWHEIEQLGKTSIVKKILTEGNGWERPQLGSTVEIRIAYARTTGPASVTFAENKTETVTLMSGALPEALDIGIAEMKKGEKALIKAPAEYGYGRSGAQQHNIPPSEPLEFEVELVSFEKMKESWDMSRDEKLESMKKLRETGNTLFKDGKPRLAVKHYEKAVDYFSISDSDSATEKEEVDGICLPCHLNLSLCYLKMGDASKANVHATKALKIDPKNVKALYRRAQAFMDSKDYVKSIQDCEVALEVVTDDDSIRCQVKLLMKKAKDAAREIEKKEKALFAKMMAGL
ncbi:hypothetical protein HDU85_004500 [Gaertneriomyces sp. JEL0708]|nr:hypothetical protein HDU85_004500 [Gaertneriomyces sp. JEL0708]